ncbi:5-deoxy-glucuronate isomerase [Gordonia sp. VNK21]|uniref:5-deoxy-glucuronate isomerase n=1 Tax=Gordonia sp. VNK21 TaxID=3382483 RepID=UPI0038D460C7
MSPTPNEWFRPRGELARDGWTAVVDTSVPGWQYTGLHVADLEDQARSLPAGPLERLVVPLSGTFEIEHDDVDGRPARTALSGRTGVFAGPTDSLYLGPGTALTLRGIGRVAIASAPASDARPPRRLPAGRVPVEIRGAGRDTRQVHNLGTPEILEAQSLIVCEVITPAGNWSSHPAHKHDEHRPGAEARLEEIYYFEAAPARGIEAVPAAAEPFGTFSTYSSGAGQIATDARVRTGDIALVPFGFHGPAAAAPEYDLYYLNVMAGPDPQRRWLITDDPAQSWVRRTWEHQRPDPRLPYRSGPDGVDR